MKLINIIEAVKSYIIAAEKLFFVEINLILNFYKFKLKLIKCHINLYFDSKKKNISKSLLTSLRKIKLHM